MSVNSQAPSLPPLDFEKIKNDLQHGSERTKILLLQALRWVSLIDVGRGVGGCERPDPPLEKIFEIDREIPLTRIFF
jgi:hypothetical protein